MKFPDSSPVHHRPTWVEVAADAFRDNLRALETHLRSGVRMIVVLKADGYGHGAVTLARAVMRKPPRALWGFGVSSVEEGAALRRAGLRRPILILGSLFPFEGFATALKLRLTPTVASRAAAVELARIAARQKVRASVHLKVDTGMARIGMAPGTALETARWVRRRPSLRLEGIYTHFSNASSRGVTSRQLSRFNRLRRALARDGSGVLAHAANSAALLSRRDAQCDAVRPGLSAFGISPLPRARLPVRLKPVLSWKTRIVFLKTVAAGVAVSYGGTYVTTRRTRLATLPVGYADGYRRALSNKARVLVGGRKCPVVGRVTMDQIMVDVSRVRGVKVGSEAVLIGRQGREKVTVEEMARWAGTIPYEVVCGIGRRVPRCTPGRGG